MKALSYLKILLLCMSAMIVVGACDDDDFFERDEDYLFEVGNRLVGREWTGDVGMNAKNGEPIFSTFCFDSHHRGTEYQYYTRDGLEYARYSFRWHTEYCADCGACSVVLDYGIDGVSYMDEVYFSGRNFRGMFFLDRGARGVPFSLRME